PGFHAVFGAQPVSDKPRQKNQTGADFFPVRFAEFCPRSGRRVSHALQRNAKRQTSKLINPILPPHSADPWMIFHGGFYYYCESAHGDTAIRIRKAKTIAGIGQDEGVVVWNAPQSGMNSREVWAAELHFINGKFFIYYAADDG